MFWPASCQWPILCKQGLQPCLDLLQQMTTSSAAADVSASTAASQMVATDESVLTSPSQTAAADESALTAASQTAAADESLVTTDAETAATARESSAASASTASMNDACCLANTIWHKFSQDLLRSCTELLKFLQMISNLEAQWVATQILDKMQAEVSRLLIQRIGFCKPTPC